MGHSRKHPYLPHRGNWKTTPPSPSDVLIHYYQKQIFLLNFLLGGVWIFCGMTQYCIKMYTKVYLFFHIIYFQHARPHKIHWKLQDQARFYRLGRSHISWCYEGKANRDLSN